MPLSFRQLLCGFLFLTLFAQQARAQVLIDAGHSAKSPGSTSFYGQAEHVYTEKMKNLVLIHLARMKIPSSGISQNGTLEERAKTRGTLLVSLHYDSVPQKMRDNGEAQTKSGFSVHVSRKNPFYLSSSLCAQSVGWNMLRIGEHRSSYRNHLEFFRSHHEKLFGVHVFDNLRILRHAEQPALLVELGVWANAREESRLLRPETMDKQAQAIAEGIRRCYGVISKKPRRPVKKLMSPLFQKDK